MKQYTYTKTRENLRSILNQVCADHEPVRVTRRRGDNVIMISEEDYGSLVETAYLLRSPRNAERLQAAKARNAATAKDLEMVLSELDPFGKRT